MEILPAIYLQVSNLYNYWLVVSAPEKYESAGIIIPNIWKNISNHQPDYIYPNFIWDIYMGYWYY